MFAKLPLVQPLENLPSDRKLVALASLHVGIRAVLGYELAQPLPSHRTISRSRQRLPVSFFEACFTHVVDLWVQQGLVSGHTQVVDSAHSKASAATGLYLRGRRPVIAASAARASAWRLTDSSWTATAMPVTAIYI